MPPNKSRVDQQREVNTPTRSPPLLYSQIEKVSNTHTPFPPSPILVVTLDVPFQPGFNPHLREHTSHGEAFGTMAFLGNLFGKKKTPEEQMREYKRGIDRTVRELERERVKMQNNEKKLVAEMRKMAKSNQQEALKVMAKDIVRTRAYCTKFYKMKAQMQAVSLKLQTLNSTAQMANAMKGVTRSMYAFFLSCSLSLCWDRTTSRINA